MAGGTTTREYRLPAKVQTIRQIHDRRVRNAQEAVEKLRREAAKTLEPHEEAVRDAARAFQDAIDEEHLETGLDPETTPRAKRDPQRIRRQHVLERALVDARIVRDKVAEELARGMEESPEGRRFIEVREERARWTERVLLQIGAAPADVDWEKGIATIHEDENEFPSDLLEVPE